MEPEIAALMGELARSGREHDAREPVRTRRLLNITPDTGAFLAVLVLATRPARIVEIGTSNGYSAIWLAQAARGHGGRLVTVEVAADKVALAAANLARAGLSATVEQVAGEAGTALAGMAGEGVDLLFLDADRAGYAALWPELVRVLAPGGLLVVDNAVSHADEVAPLVRLIDADPRFARSLVPVGKGELLAVKRATASVGARLR